MLPYTIITIVSIVKNSIPSSKFLEDNGFCEAEEVFAGADICEAEISYQLPEGNVLRSSRCLHIAYRGG